MMGDEMVNALREYAHEVGVHFSKHQVRVEFYRDSSGRMHCLVFTQVATGLSDLAPVADLAL